MQKKVKKKVMNDPELQTLFNTMVGIEDPDMEIAAPKYEALMTNLRGISNILRRTFLESNFIKPEIISDFRAGFDQIKIFCDSCEAELKACHVEKQKRVLSQSDISDLNSNPEKLMEYINGLSSEYDYKQLIEAYKKIKDSEIIERVITGMRDLMSHLDYNQKLKKKEFHDLSKRDYLSDSFILNGKDEFLQLLPSITVLDFAQLWIHEDFTYDCKKRIIYSLYLFLQHAEEMYQKISMPDIDVNKFSEILIDNIDKVRKQIPRCDKAFNKIKASVGLLKNNFGNYYKDFVVAKNANVIIENFIYDVADSNKADREVTSQFKTIINFFKKAVQQNQVKDPRVSKIFDFLGKNISKMEDEESNSEEK